VLSRQNGNWNMFQKYVTTARPEPTLDEWALRRA
jgi:hypothetical protein